MWKIGKKSWRAFPEPSNFGWAWLSESLGAVTRLEQESRWGFGKPHCPCFLSPKDRQRGAAGEAAAGVAGLLRDGGRGSRGHAEELPPAQPPAGHPDGGEVARPLPPDPALHVPVRRRGGRGWRRWVRGNKVQMSSAECVTPSERCAVAVGCGTPQV